MLEIFELENWINRIDNIAKKRTVTEESSDPTEVSQLDHGSFFQQ